MPRVSTLIALAGLALAAAVPVAQGEGLALAPCRLEHPYGLGSVAARCGRFPVADHVACAPSG